jgi:plasmid stabilization system protein ParE
VAELRWHVDAIQDLDAIGQFIARESPEFAPRFVARIYAAAHPLADMPRMGRVVPELNNEVYRELIFQSYRIVYRIEGSVVNVIGVINAAMDMESQIGSRAWDMT